MACRCAHGWLRILPTVRASPRLHLGSTTHFFRLPFCAVSPTHLSDFTLSAAFRSLTASRCVAGLPAALHLSPRVVSASVESTSSATSSPIIMTWMPASQLSSCWSFWATRSTCPITSKADGLRFPRGLSGEPRASPMRTSVGCPRLFQGKSRSWVSNRPRSSVSAMNTLRWSILRCAKLPESSHPIVYCSTSSLSARPMLAESTVRVLPMRSAPFRFMATATRKPSLQPILP